MVGGDGGKRAEGAFGRVSIAVGIDTKSIQHMALGMITLLDQSRIAAFRAGTYLIRGSPQHTSGCGAETRNDEDKGEDHIARKSSAVSCR
jgi:hypothetical protein